MVDIAYQPEAEEDKIMHGYCLLALYVFFQAFNDVGCYYMKRGTEEERRTGRQDINWIRKMRGNFRILSSASNMTIEQFHQLCLWKLNSIKTYARRRIQETHSRKQGSRVRYMPLVPTECGQKKSFSITQM